eukprot:3753777-Amphidinium_carterae.2
MAAHASAPFSGQSNRVPDCDVRPTYGIPQYVQTNVSPGTSPLPPLDQMPVIIPVPALIPVQPEPDSRSFAKIWRDLLPDKRISGEDYLRLKLRAARDPTVNSADAFVMETIETERLSLPMNLIWCFDELNLYVRTGDFSLAFQMELMKLMNYFEASIRQLCTSTSEYGQVRDLFFTMDQPYGPPDRFETPPELLSEWNNWSHRKSQEFGFKAEDSEKHIMTGDVTFAEQGQPKRPKYRLPPLQAPCGIYPRHFLVDQYPPDATNEPVETQLMSRFEDEPDPEEGDELEDFQYQHQLFQMVTAQNEETTVTTATPESVSEPVTSSSAAAVPPLVKAPPPALVEQLTSSSASNPAPSASAKEVPKADTSEKKETLAAQPAVGPVPTEKRFEGDFWEWPEDF